MLKGCILSKFYIKPPPRCRYNSYCNVVSYRNSTSNHNLFETIMAIRRLYLIEILHQTTTCVKYVSKVDGCILSKFYIKPQLSCILFLICRGCILSKFYIKPQQRIRHKIGHSCCILSKFYIKPQQVKLQDCMRLSCILSKFYIKPQLAVLFALLDLCCILSKFYIKPQLRAVCS